MELGVHRNTAAKAYKSLAELGLVYDHTGPGHVRVRRVEPDNRRLHAQQISDRLADRILRARRSNISEDDLRRTIDEQIAADLPRATPRGICRVQRRGFAGRHRRDRATERRPPGAGLLDALAADPDGIGGAATTRLHQPLSPAGGAGAFWRTRRRPPHRRHSHQPDERALAEIAQIEPATRVGIVVSDEDGARRYRAQIQTYTQASHAGLVRPTDEAIVELAREVDLIVISRSRAAQIRRLHLDLPMIELSFHISRESAQRVVEALYGSG